MKNQLRTILLLGVLTALMIGVGAMIGRGFLYLFAALAIAMNFAAYFWSDRVVLRMSRARPIEDDEAPRLHAMVEEISVRAGIPKPRVYWIDDEQPNAFATGRNPEHGVVAVTSGLMRRLTEREIRGVIAHEIAHIRNRDILVASVAAMLASVVTSVANALQFAAIFGGGGSDHEEGGSPLGGLVWALLAPIGATLVQLAISRSREYLADETAANLTGDPEALARALERLHEHAEEIEPTHAQPATASLYIVNPLSGGSMLGSLFSTHPAAQKRIERLRAMIGMERLHAISGGYRAA
ncbi:MAG: zinc metalloprotease HtpX [Deltaproteobacteria bacterium]|nr:zinc metalloprotease HtpX [Deltaproteobacteria bacterium]